MRVPSRMIRGWVVGALFGLSVALVRTGETSSLESLLASSDPSLALPAAQMTYRAVPLEGGAFCYGAAPPPASYAYCAPRYAPSRAPSPAAADRRGARPTRAGG